MVASVAEPPEVVASALAPLMAVVLTSELSVCPAKTTEVLNNP